MAFLFISDIYNTIFVIAKFSSYCAAPIFFFSPKLQKPFMSLVWHFLSFPFVTHLTIDSHFLIHPTMIQYYRKLQIFFFYRTHPREALHIDLGFSCYVSTFYLIVFPPFVPWAHSDCYKTGSDNKFLLQEPRHSYSSLYSSP